MKNNRCLILLVVLVIIFMGYATVTTANAQEKVILKLHLTHGTIHPFEEGVLHPNMAGAVRLAELLNEKSGGILEIVIYPASALGEDTKILELMQEGIVDIGFSIPVTKVANIISDLNVFSFPFLFVSAEHGKAFAESEKGVELLKSAEEHGLVGLGFTNFFPRYPINRVKPITKVEDFKGLKFRTMGLPAALDTYRYLGANTVSIPFPELYTSLQLGVIDGVENDLLTILSQNYHEVAKYLTLAPVWPFATIFLVSKKTWDKLSPTHQQILQESVPEALEVMSSEYERSFDAVIDILKSEGVTVTTPSDIKPFREAVQPVYDDLLSKLTKEQQDMVSYILELAEEY